MLDRSDYKVGVVLSCEEAAKKKGSRPLIILKVDVGNGKEDGVPVVTNAPNVREGSRVVVVLAGSVVVGEGGEEITLTKTSVAGYPSHGMICDSKMLGWSGGAEGIAAQIGTNQELQSLQSFTAIVKILGALSLFCTFVFH
jgi:tRNA-binding EMAP/Myf-like protein